MADRGFISLFREHTLQSYSDATFRSRRVVGCYLVLVRDSREEPEPDDRCLELDDTDPERDLVVLREDEVRVLGFAGTYPVLTSSEELRTEELRVLFRDVRVRLGALFAVVPDTLGAVAVPELYVFRDRDVLS